MSLLVFKKAGLFILACLSCFSCVFPVLAGTISKTPASNSSTATATDKRTLKFPADVSVGDVYVVTPLTHEPGTFDRSSSGKVANAKGTVTVSVPHDRWLMLAIARQAFSDPSSLAEISVDGIDVLMVSYYGMDDSDKSVSKTLQYLPRFKNMRCLDINRSDACDTDLLKLKGLAKLQGITGFMSEIHGACFKDFRSNPELQSLDFDGCPINGTNLAYLTAIPKLTKLSLSRTRLDVSGIKQIAGCRSLISLTIASNPKVDDKCMQYLSALRHLTRIDLRTTSVTLDGLAALKGLPLNNLILPKKAYSPDEMATIKHTFPKAKLETWNSGVSSEDKTLFAPLH